MKITLATLKDATAQQVFDQVYIHLMTQKKQSIAIPTGSACAYRGYDGGMCAAGCLISDDEAKVLIAKGFNTSSWDTVDFKFGLNGIHSTLIHNLQQVHDCFSFEMWAGELKRVADVHKLTIPEMPQ